MDISWRKFLDTFKHGFWNTFLKNRKSVHIYLALAIDRFPSSGLKQKSFSPEWKKIYLLWIHGQDAIELVSTTGYFHTYRLCPCCSVPGSLSAPQKSQSLYCLHPQSHCKGNPSIEAGLSSAPQPVSPLPSCALVCKDALTPFCTHPMLDEPLATRGWRWGWCLQGSCALVQLCWHGLVKHTPASPAHAQQKLVPSAWCCECAKALPAATM